MIQGFRFYDGYRHRAIPEREKCDGRTAAPRPQAHALPFSGAQPCAAEEYTKKVKETAFF